MTVRPAGVEVSFAPASVFHLVWGRDHYGWYRTGCTCTIGREHAIGARGEAEVS